MTEALHVWGEGWWDNDAAMDLVSRLHESAAPSAELEASLRQGATPDADPSACARALAAADLAASTRGTPSTDLPDDARELVGLFLLYASDETLALAQTAVLAAGAETSALHRTWTQAAEAQRWRERVARLGERLAQMLARGALALVLVLTLALALSLSTAHAQRSIQIYTGSSPKSVTISPDGRLAYVMNLEECSVSAFDTATHTRVRTIRFPQTPATGYDYKLNKPIPSVAEKPVEAAFTHGGRYLWVSFHNAAAVGVFAVEGSGFDPRSHRRTMRATVKEADGRLWGRQMLMIPTGETPKVIKVSPNGAWVAVSNWHGNSVTIIDARSFKPIRTLPVSSIPRGMAFTADSRKLFVAIMGGSQIEVFHTKGWKRSSTITNVGLAPRDLALDRAGRWLYASCNSSGIVTRIDAATGRVRGSVAVGSEPRTVGLSPDERRLYACCYGSNRLYVLDARTFRVVDTWPTGENPVGMAVAPTGDIWVTNQSGDSVTLFPASPMPTSRAGRAPQAGSADSRRQP